MRELDEANRLATVVATSSFRVEAAVRPAYAPCLSDALGYPVQVVVETD